MTTVTSRHLDALNQWWLHCILHIMYVAHITNEDTRHTTRQPPVTTAIMTKWLSLFGHII